MNLLLMRVNARNPNDKRLLPALVKLTEESGATSVMIISMMMVLVTLGAYSISSARINYAFSNKALEWNKKYYECDRQAEVFFMDVDTVLAKAEKQTAQVALQLNSDETEYGIDRILAENAEHIFNELYMQNITSELTSLTAKYPDMAVNEDASVIDMTITIDNSSYIEVKIAVLPFRYSIESQDGEISGVLNESNKRCHILQWSQNQVINDPVQPPLWDGQIS